MRIKQVEVSDKSKESIAKAASQKLNESLYDAYSKNLPILLLLSGGSSLDLLEGIDISNLDNRVTVTVLDERYSKDPKSNNFAQIAETEFYKRAKGSGVNFIDTRVQLGETQEKLAVRFNEALNYWIKNNPNGRIITTVGIGPDGHTSGIMPYPEDAETFKRMFDNGNENELITSYDASGKNEFTARITTNINFMRKIGTAIVYAVGENKKEALEKIKSEDGSLNETPARILREIKGSVLLFTDQ